MAVSLTHNANASSAVSASTLALTVGSTIGSSARATIIVGCDNANANGAGTNEITGVTDSRGNTWTKESEKSFSPSSGVTANDGTTTAVFTTTQDGGQLQAGDTVTISFASAKLSKVAQLWSAAPGSGGAPQVHSTVIETGLSTNVPSTTTASLSSGDSVLGWWTAETNAGATITADSDTTNGTWSAGQDAVANTGTSSTSQRVYAQGKDVTGAGTQQFNLTASLSRDGLAAHIVFREQTATTVTPTTGAISTTSFAPVANVNQRVTPSTLATVLTGFAPTVHVGKIVTPGTASLTLTPYAPSTTHPFRLKNFADEGDHRAVIVRDVFDSEAGYEWLGPADFAEIIEPHLNVAPSTENTVPNWVPGIRKDKAGLAITSYHFKPAYSPALEMWCVVGTQDPETDAHIAISTDGGITWTDAAVPADVLILNSVVWANELSLWCAVGADDSGDPIACTSPDGVTWTRRGTGITAAEIASFANVVWTGSLFLAVGGSVNVATSPDGATWTKRLTGITGVTEWVGCAWTGAAFVICGTTTGAVGCRAATSPDGVTWTMRQVDAAAQNFEMRGAACNPDLGIVVIVGEDPVGGGAVAYWSDDDGATWTAVEGIFTGDVGPWYDVIWNGTVFVSIANASSGVEGAAYVSRDGISWVFRVVLTWGEIVFGIGADDDGNCIVAGEAFCFWKGGR